MLSFIARRLILSVFILLGATFIIYNLFAFSTNPLADLEESTALNKQQLIDNRVRLMHLDVPAPVRYFMWLGALFTGDMGTNIAGAPVNGIIGDAAAQSLQMVTLAAIIAAIVGITIGMTTAIRQYSGYDYSITLLSFLAFSLPVFVLAVLLKQYFAIGFNDFLQNPVISIPALLIIAAVIALCVQVIMGGYLKKRIINFAVAFVIVAGVLLFMQTDFGFGAGSFWQDPQLGWPLILLLGILIALAVTALSTGLRMRRALIAALIPPVIAAAMWYPMFFVLGDTVPFWVVPVVVIAFTVVSGVIGWLIGGFDKGPVARTAAISGFFAGLLLIIDRVAQAWTLYVHTVGGRPVPTIGATTPGLSRDNVWLAILDTGMHLFLPTLSLALISIASYSRYARGSLLEVLNQDYVRTARAKGLTERTVIMRHAFRNAMIPIATIVAADVGGLVGGAVITETIFGWRAMGTVFSSSLAIGDINPFMGFILITSALTLLFNLIADLMYSVLDPRIRVNS